MQGTIFFLSPPPIGRIAPNSPTFEKEFAESAFFRKINKILPRRTQFLSANEWETIKSTLLLQCRTPSNFYLLPPPPPIFPPTVLPRRKNSLSLHFFEKLVRYYQEEHNLMREWMRNTKINSWATMEDTTYFLSPPPILPPTVLPPRKNSLSQHFFEKLVRYYQEEHNLMREWMRNTKIDSLATMQDTTYFL